MSVFVELGISGFTGNRILKVNGEWHLAECSTETGEVGKNCHNNLANLHRVKIDAVAQVLVNS